MKRFIVPMTGVLVILLLVCPAISPVFGQTARLQLTNLERLAGKAEEVVDVTLDGTILRLAARFFSDEDDSEEAQVKSIIQNLQGIYVKSFEFNKEGEYSPQDVDAIRSQLRAPGWSRMVGYTSKRDGQNAEVYVMTDSGTGKVLGMAIISTEPRELTIVNIVGSIDIEKIADLEGKMGIPPLKLEKSKESKKKPRGVEEPA